MLLEPSGIKFSWKPGVTMDIVIIVTPFILCSRPTAVNLSDAAKKLKEVFLEVASTSSEVRTVFQVSV